MIEKIGEQDKIRPLPLNRIGLTMQQGCDKILDCLENSLIRVIIERFRVGCPPNLDYYAVTYY